MRVLSKAKIMSILDNCTTLDIEKITNNKDLILNATSQNDAIKIIGMGRSLKPLCKRWRLSIKNKIVLPS